MTDRKNIILFVDDEPHILSSIRRAMISNSFEAIFAGSAKEALQLIEQHPVSVIVTDMKMPVMDGLTLLKIVKERHPKIVRMVLSGYAQMSQVLATVNQGEIFQFISKPWLMEEELLVGVRQAIERFNIEAERDNLQEGLAQKNLAYLNIFHAMEQKLINEKKDLTSLKHINHWMFAFWKKHLEICTGTTCGNLDNSLGQVDLIEEIYVKYMDILPTVHEGRELEQAIAGIGKACRGRVEIERKFTGNPLLYGYYGFLEMVFKILVVLQAVDSEEAITFVMSVEPRESGAFFVIFDCVYSSPELIDQNRIKIGYSMLNEIGKAYRLRLLPQTGRQGIESVRLVWYATLDDGKE